MPADLAGPMVFEGYRLDDAVIAIVVLGSTAGTARVAVDALRNQGIKAGLLKLRVFRPFPARELAAALSNLQAIAVMDRSDTLAGTGGPLFHEVRSALYDLGSRPRVVNQIYGRGGRDITVEDIQEVYMSLHRLAAEKESLPPVQYLGVRE